MTLFSYSIEIVVNHIDSEDCSAVYLDWYKSPVQHAVGDKILIGNQECFVTDICWMFDEPGRAFMGVGTEWGVISEKDAEEWFALFSQKDEPHNTDSQTP